MFYTGKNINLPQNNYLDITWLKIDGKINLKKQTKKQKNKNKEWNKINLCTLQQTWIFLY